MAVCYLWKGSFSFEPSYRNGALDWLCHSRVTLLQVEIKITIKQTTKSQKEKKSQNLQNLRPEQAQTCYESRNSVKELKLQSTSCKIYFLKTTQNTVHPYLVLGGKYPEEHTLIPRMEAWFHYQGSQRGFDVSLYLLFYNCRQNGTVKKCEDLNINKLNLCIHSCTAPFIGSYRWTTHTDNFVQKISFARIY